ncbi:MAG: hypothetical protein Roseis2KO_38630 [Roseivirga sp.]
MNLLDKNKSLGALVIGLFLFISCEENGSFGLNGDDVAPVEFSSIDIGVTSSVVLLDSIGSSSVGTLLVGEYQNNTFGSLVAKGYSRINLNRASIFQIASEAILDSVRLNLTFNYIYDTSATASTWGLDMFSLARPVTDTLHITTDNTVISSTLLSSAEIQVTKLDSTYAIPVDEAWGADLFERLRTEDATVVDQESFERFFRGVGFVARSGVSPNILGIEMSENSNITMYYREPSSTGEIDRELTHVMNLHTVPSFYGLDLDRSGTDTESIQTFHTEYLPASGKRFIQAGAGIVTKIDISDFQNFLTDDPRIINLAEFSVGPIDQLNEDIPPPESVFLVITDDRNTLIKDQGNFRSIQRDGDSQIGSGNPVELIYDAETRTYTGSVTSYIQTYFSGRFQRNEFMIYPSNMATGLNGASFDPEDVKLKIIFSELQ